MWKELWRRIVMAVRVLVRGDPALPVQEVMRRLEVTAGRLERALGYQPDVPLLPEEPGPPDRFQVLWRAGALQRCAYSGRIRKLAEDAFERGRARPEVQASVLTDSQLVTADNPEGVVYEWFGP